MNDINLPEHWEAVRLEEISRCACRISGVTYQDIRRNIEGNIHFTKSQDMNLIGR